MVYEIYHITYDLVNLSIYRQEAIVSSSSPAEANELLRRHLSDIYDTYPRRNSDVRETDPDRLGFKSRFTEPMNSLTDGEKVFCPSSQGDIETKLGTK